MWSREHLTLPEGAQEWLEWTRLAVGIAAGIQIATLGLLAGGLALIVMLSSVSVQGVLVFLAALASFIVLPSLTLFFFYRANHKKRNFIIATLLLLFVTAVPALLLLFVKNENDFQATVISASTAVVLSWVFTLALTVVTWSKIKSAERPDS